MSESAKIRTTCPGCGTRYRLDPNRLRGAQANIKCSKCETVFRVKVGQPTREASAPYTVVHAQTGDQLAVPSIDTLKRWIIEGRVQADDTISKPGSKERRVGDIAQFKPFLRVSERSGAFDALIAPAEVVPDEKGAAASPEPIGEDVSGEPEPMPGPAADEGQAGEKPPVELGGDEAQDELDERAAPEVRAPRPAREVAEHAPLPSTSQALAELDDEPIRLETGRGTRVARLVLFVLLLAAVALAAIYFAAPDTFYTIFPFLKA